MTIAAPREPHATEKVGEVVTPQLRPTLELPPLRPRRPDPLFHAVWLGLSTLVLILSATMSIRDSRQVLIPGTQIPVPELCTFRRMTGLDCAGCGLTRCFIALGHGDVALAWKYNPVGIGLFGMVLFQIPYRTWQLWRISRGRGELDLGRWGNMVLFLFAGLLLSQWVLKQMGIFF